MAPRWSARASWLTGNSRRLSSTLGSVAKEALFGRGTSGGDGDEEELNGDLHDELMVVVMMMMIQTSNSGGGDADATVLWRVEFVASSLVVGSQRSGVFQKERKVKGSNY